MTDDFSLAMPGSVTDFTRAIRELLGSLRDISRFASDASNFYDRKKARRAAKGLATLAFAKSGMYAPLERIAAGNGSPQDLEDIARRLVQTTREVEEGIRQIFDYIDRARERFGLEIGLRLDEAISGGRYIVGKTVIRNHLKLLVHLGQQPEPDLSQIQYEAKYILQCIDSLEKKLTSLRDLLLSMNEKEKIVRKRQKTP